MAFDTVINILHRFRSCHIINWGFINCYTNRLIVNEHNHDRKGCGSLFFKLKAL